mgnify:FL=1|tara:strand:+ start:74 stop:517 length:444 start_codon:yes stop_codon:yes gene_type:complete
MLAKPFCRNSKEVLAYVDASKPVRVYRNLHKKCISVKQGTLVRCHAENVVLKDCTFIVSEAGQARVRNEGKKNVHAFIEGYVKPAYIVNQMLDFGWDTVYYNPYAVDHWVISSLPYDVYVDTAEWCDVWCDDVCGDVLAFNLTYLKD